MMSILFVKNRNYWQILICEYWSFFIFRNGKFLWDYNERKKEQIISFMKKWVSSYIFIYLHLMNNVQISFVSLLLYQNKTYIL